MQNKITSKAGIHFTWKISQIEGLIIGKRLKDQTEKHLVNVSAGRQHLTVSVNKIKIDQITLLIAVPSRNKY